MSQRHATPCRARHHASIARGESAGAQGQVRPWSSLLLHAKVTIGSSPSHLEVFSKNRIEREQSEMDVSLATNSGHGHGEVCRTPLPLINLYTMAKPPHTYTYCMSRRIFYGRM